VYPDFEGERYGCMIFKMYDDRFHRQIPHLLHPGIFRIGEEEQLKPSAVDLVEEERKKEGIRRGRKERREERDRRKKGKGNPTGILLRSLPDE
jgi:hypothetical protein